MSKTVWIINQYASTPSTGLGGRHYYMAREMAKQGYNVYIIASSSHHLLRNKPLINDDIMLDEVDGFTFVWVKMPPYEDAHSKKRALSWFLFSWRLRKVVRFIEDKPDAILSSSPSLLSFLGAKKLARRMKARLIFEVRDIWPLTLTEIGGFSGKHPFVKLMQWVEDKAYSEADSVISNLKNSVEHMADHGMSPDKFTWVPNGFSLDEVNQKVALGEKAASQLPRDKFIIGYTGTMGVANALDTLVEAAERLRQYPEISFVLVGGGKERVALEASVKEKNLDNVIFVDPIPKVEIQAMLEKFDVCYIGLKKDPLFRFGVSPNKLFDYFYSAKPIIYGIESGSYKPVSSANAGIQIPAENSEKLAEAVLTLYRMPSEKRKRLGRNGQITALEKYEYSLLADSLSKVLFE